MGEGGFAVEKAKKGSPTPDLKLPNRAPKDIPKVVAEATESNPGAQHSGGSFRGRLGGFRSGPIGLYSKGVYTVSGR